MHSIAIRPFRRDDRDQLTALVNAHVAAVIPGITLSVNSVISQLEREPSETIVDPWVVERRTLVAVQRKQIVAGAHLHRYGDADEVGPDYRNAGSIHWLVAAHEANEAADALIAACLELMDGWQVRIQLAGGELPSLATYGVPSTWPHIRALYVRAGFEHVRERTPFETIHVAEVDRLPTGTAPPFEGLAVERVVGACGTRFSAVLDGTVVGLIEVESRDSLNIRAQVGWADIGNLWVDEEHRRRGIATWLLGVAADWLRFGGIERLLTYTWPSEENEVAFIEHHGFRELVRTERGWVRRTVAADQPTPSSARRPSTSSSVL
jgi:GNAT superfamily N-acetyltransferase